jgi:CheY-like chemotaxis protein
MEQKTVRPVEILLVEDNPGDVLLSQEGFEASKICNNLHVVYDGEEALSFLYREGKFADSPRPDLILLDLNLPRKSGHEVLEIIKQDEKLRTIPVVVLSVSSDVKDIQKVYYNYANCFISKPIQFHQFSEIVQQIKQFWFAIVTLPPTKA